MITMLIAAGKPPGTRATLTDEGRWICADRAILATLKALAGPGAAEGQTPDLGAALAAIVIAQWPGSGVIAERNGPVRFRPDVQY